MELNLEDSTALVTGSSKGLGKGAATALVREGGNVVINGRNQDQLEETANEIREIGSGEVIAQQADLTVADDISQLVQRTVDEFGGLDHLVTSAGGPASKPFLETNAEEWYHAYDLLVMSVARLVWESAEYLQADGGGSIVNITSHSVKEAIDGLVLSSSVRMSVIGLEKTLSRELGPHVRVNSVMPGAHSTDRIEYLFEKWVDQGKYDTYDEVYEDYIEDVPVNHLGDPDEFGNIIAFLCSDRASFINGEAVMIDGGEARSNL